MRNLVLAAAALAVAAPTVANAAFVVTFPSSAAIPGPATPSNDFLLDLQALGLFGFASTGASIALDAADIIDFYFMGSESGVTNTFQAYSVGPFNETDSNHFASGDNSPVLIGSEALLAGAFSATFLANGTDVVNIGNQQFGIATPSILANGGSFTSNDIYFLLDDNPANGDDNHDDMIIRATVRSAVPEPTTWAMMLGGFGIVGSLMRRRNVTTRVSFA
ncbi:MAG: PEPxxWA-CTERM sorting domain-containing protein [Sphingomonadaceae bacterium]